MISIRAVADHTARLEMCQPAVAVDDILMRRQILSGFTARTFFPPPAFYCK
jgi:hypothetical protein